MGALMSQFAVDDYFSRIVETLTHIDKTSLVDSVTHLKNQIKDGRRIFIAGNGGSSSIASHMVNDLTKGLHSMGKDTTLVMSLNDNYPTVSAIANDLNFESVFRVQLEMFARKGDSIILVSGSGNSRNILEAAQYAKQNEITVIGLTGFSGGKLFEIADFNFHIPIEDMQISEDLMSMFGHIVYKTILE
jgi:D-sedoheptulose 7-phosphate isomerase